MKTIEQMRWDLAHAFFVDCCNDKDYPHKTVQGQCDEMKCLTGEQIIRMHRFDFPDDHEERSHEPVHQEVL